MSSFSGCSSARSLARMLSATGVLLLAPPPSLPLPLLPLELEPSLSVADAPLPLLAAGAAEDGDAAPALSSSLAPACCM